MYPNLIKETGGYQHVTDWTCKVTPGSQTLMPKNLSDQYWTEVNTKLQLPSITAFEHGVNPSITLATSRTHCGLNHLPYNSKFPHAHTTIDIMHIDSTNPMAPVLTQTTAFTCWNVRLDSSQLEIKFRVLGIRKNFKNLATVCQ